MERAQFQDLKTLVLADDPESFHRENGKYKHLPQHLLSPTKHTFMLAEGEKRQERFRVTAGVGGRGKSPAPDENTDPSSYKKVRWRDRNPVMDLEGRRSQTTSVAEGPKSAREPLKCLELCVCVCVFECACTSLGDRSDHQA